MIPRKEAESAVLLLSTDADAHLLLTLGFFRQFDSEQNNAEPNQSPQSSFKNKPHIKGMNKLEMYGSMGFEILYCVASGLGVLFQDHLCGVPTPAAVPKITLNVTSRTSAV